MGEDVDFLCKFFFFSHLGELPLSLPDCSSPTTKELSSQGLGPSKTAPDGVFQRLFGQAHPGSIPIVKPQPKLKAQHI